MNAWEGKSSSNAGRTHWRENLVIVFLAVAAINLGFVLLTGGYAFALGRLRFSAHHIEGPLLLLLSAAMAAVWLREKRRGIPVPKRLRSPLLLFLAAVFIYNLNGRLIGAGDTIPASYMPLSILREFDFDLDEFPFLHETGFPFFLLRINERVISAYPPWAGVLALPVYLLSVVGGLSSQSPLIHDLQKLSASLITALSVLLLLLGLRRLTTEKIAWFIAIVYAFGTSSFSSSSQALWQHGASQLFLTLTIYWLVRGLDEPRFSAYAGFALAGAVVCRPTNAFMTIPIAAYVLWHHRAHFVGFLVAAVPPVLIFTAYNMRYFGSPITTAFTGETGPSRIWTSGSHLFSTPLFEGLAGVLASPGRGLFIYSPILLVSIVGVVMVWRDRQQVLLKYLSLAPLPLVLLTSKWVAWWGGGSYGPRLLADITPILCVYLYLPFECARSRRLLQYTFACLAVLSIGLHAVRVFGGGDWNGHSNVDWHPERLWSWGDSPPVYYGKNLIIGTYAKLKALATRFPTSRDAPHKLTASYQLVDLIPGATLPPSTFIRCHLRVLNTGEAIWLARAKWEKGEVRLRWRWFAGDPEVLASEGGWILGYDVLPRQAYEFMVEIATPKEPGEYTLELGLVSTMVTSFAEQGIVPIRLPVRVTRLAQQG
jgi:Dolichyl-phosphate-mannose-protein mannosyltransferase